VTLGNKLTALAKAARELNDSGAVWAVGASALMYLEGDAETFGDLDLLIGQGWMDAARQALRTAGAQELAPRPPSDVYLTEQFCECRLDQVDFDLLCGFAVRREGVAYRYPFEARRIVKTVAVLGENVPLSPPADWYVLYRLMPDHGDKADVIARRLAARPREEWAPWLEEWLSGPLPDELRWRVRALLESAGQ